MTTHRCASIVAAFFCIAASHAEAQERIARLETPPGWGNSALYGTWLFNAQEKVAGQFFYVYTTGDIDTRFAAMNDALTKRAADDAKAWSGLAAATKAELLDAINKADGGTLSQAQINTIIQAVTPIVRQKVARELLDDVEFLDAVASRVRK